MSATEFEDWWYFNHREPIGPERLDWNAARMVQVMMALKGGRRGRRSIKRLLPDWWGDLKQTKKGIGETLKAFGQHYRQSFIENLQRVWDRRRSKQ